jgi:adenosylhomocysteine nucleosidase
VKPSPNKLAVSDKRYPWSGYLSRRAALAVELSAASVLFPVVALVGLAFEARIAAGHGVLVVCRGSGCELSGALQRALQDGCRSIISFGVAGGLAPDLRAGDVVVASAIRDSHIVRQTDPIWSRKLLAAVPDIRHGPVVGVNSAVVDPEAKRALYVGTGAVAVDMESHLVARAADAYNLAFAAVRVVVDPVHRAIPQAALMAMGPAGAVYISPVLREIMARPSQLAAFVRVAVDAYLARSALLRVRRIVGPTFGFSELRESTPFDAGFIPER